MIQNINSAFFIFIYFARGIKYGKLLSWILNENETEIRKVAQKNFLRFAFLHFHNAYF